MSIIQKFECQLIEKELVNVEIVEKELTNVEIKEIDVLDYYEKYIISNLTVETPTKLSAKRFQTSKEFVPTAILPFFNGIKEKYFSIINSTTFEFEIPTIDTDLVEVAYVEKV